MVDGWFFGHFFWKVEGSSAHTRESRATHVCHMQLTCGKLLYGGGEPSRVAHVCHMCHMWQLTCTLLLYGVGEPSRVPHVCHVWNVWQLTCTLLLYGGEEPSRVAHVCHVWQLRAHYYYMVEGALTCGSQVSRVSCVAINMHVTTIWWRGALTCGSHAW